MTENRYDRFDIQRPKFIGDEHWKCIAVEIDRLLRSLNADDDSQVLSDIKCLVEATAKVALDIAGLPTDPTSYDRTVKRAHDILAKQPGNDLTRVSDFAHIASQSSKIARKLGSIRNQFGGGHGRARIPDIRDEMVDLALDGGLIWTRWAVRRLGLLSEGRPEDLIRDLVEEPATFRSGDLRRRLEAANLPDLEPHHQRELGVAVGQRVMRQTFVVRWDGLDPCLESDDLTIWPAYYRIGLLHGLWFAPDDQPTVTCWSLRMGIEVIDPIPDASEELQEQVKLACASAQFFLPDGDPKDRQEILKWLENHITDRPASEHPALTQLLHHLDGQSSYTVPDI